jgi:transcription initiation factor IIE alpha subunit
MTKFYKKKRKDDPFTIAVADVMNKVNRKVTPSEIAGYLGIHPNTAKSRILKLRRSGHVKCEKVGNKLYCSRKKKYRI